MENALNPFRDIPPLDINKTAQEILVAARINLHLFTCGSCGSHDISVPVREEMAFLSEVVAVLQSFDAMRTEALAAQHERIVDLESVTIRPVVICK